MPSKSKTTATAEKANPALVPKLRFPEFREAKAWSKVRLIDTADRSVKWSFIGGPFGSNLKSSDYVSNGVRIIQLQNIGDGEFLNEYRIFTSTEKADDLLSNNIYPGEIIMSKMGDPVGRACLIPEQHERYVMCSDGIRLVVDEKAHDKFFVYSVINSPPFRGSVEKTATGSTRKRIGLDELKSLPMWLPKKPEQQKIAECLSSMGEAIAAQARKLDALKTHKKGLMQQLFPREGETQPRLRFPEFQNTGAWAAEPLGELASYQNGKAYEQDIAETGRYVVVNSRFISTDGAVRKYTNADYLIAEAGEVLMVLSDLPKGKALAKCYFVEANDRYAVNQRVCRLTPKRIDGKFLYYSLNRHPRLLAFDDGLNQTHLSKGGVTECPLCVPQDKDEQHCIASCLSHLDALIAAETQKYAALQRHKRGLMQQLFPSLEEVEA